MKKYTILEKPSSRIVFRYCAIAAVFLIVIALLLPVLLNYAPGSINTEFDVKMSYISYTQQFLIIGWVILAIIFVTLKLLLKDIDLWYKNSKNKSINTDKKTIAKIRKKCFNLPYLVFLAEILFPTIGISSVIFFTGSHHSIMIVKILILIISITFLLAIFTYIFSKDLYAEILSSTYKEGIDLSTRINLKSKIFIQIFPAFVSVILITSFIGYSRSVKAKEDIFFKVYSEKLNTVFNTNTIYSIDEIENKLKDISFYNEDDFSFILLNNKIISPSGIEPSDFMVSYTKELSQLYNGRTYDSYGVDTQGATIYLQTTSGPCYVCIAYSISSLETLYFLLANAIVLMILVSFVLYYSSKSLSQDIKTVTDGLNNISNNSKLLYNKKLPVISNDEFGDLVIAFNKVQALTHEQITQIQNNQSMLMERERLASLGQLIGGIAHNLKTPIMSISGAAEGLTDLIKEYDSSIDDPEVNSQDHHDIAKDMDSWVVKIKDYTSYMSDIITAVKGQAVTLSETENMTFDVEELIKRVNILMRHELKNAIIYLNVVMKSNEHTQINGDVNSLVQVINNMISNAIQSYEGKTNQTIDLIVENDDKNLYISIRDHGCGLPKKVKDKLFKEMITTKGKNGTGLGLYMSYSTIKAHFGGDITFDSVEGQGTTFTITLPL